ncbi:hypothetical protein [Streptomyces naganishii]|uniref:Uncharacterized protein n=1 Tax=Streptomyces naganishii JCM 4654 TaxID=1306179 RepID=A0A919CU91_9ACTN|nr:hypothetical protein [Streptomyces naganishii]GHD83897.1 hypothetical protein GCM10010508_01350 [Streptomyces naganishii JCM 4654]
MNASRARRLLATSAVGVLLAGGAAIGTAGTASAATQTQAPTNLRHGCWSGGWWDRDCGFGNRGDFNRTGLIGTGGVVVIVVS